MPPWFKKAFTSGYLNVLNTKACQSNISLTKMGKFILANFVEKYKDEEGTEHDRKDSNGVYVFKNDEQLYKVPAYREYQKEVRSRGPLPSPLVIG
jgi:hypothetical protein